MDMRIPPLNIMIMIGSNPLKSRILVRRLAVTTMLLGEFAHDCSQGLEA